MPQSQRLSRTRATSLASQPPRVVVDLLRFGPRPDGSRPTAEEILTHARRLVERPDPHPTVARLRQRIRHVPSDVGRPFWEDDPLFDVHRHLAVHAASSPVPTQVRSELVRDALHRTLDQNRPLWRAELVDCFSDSTLGLLLTYHEAIADPTSFYTAIALLTMGPQAESSSTVSAVERWVPAPPASGSAVISEAIFDRVTSVPGALERMVRSLRRADLETSTAAVARLGSFLHQASRPDEGRGSVSGSSVTENDEATLDAWSTPLLDLRIASRGLGSSTTDLLLAAAASAWSSIEPSASTVRVRIPTFFASARQSPGDDEIGDALVDLPCGLDLLRTLRAVQDTGISTNRQDRARTLAQVQRFVPRLPGAAGRSLLGSKYGCDLVLSHVPGLNGAWSCHGAPLWEVLGSSTLRRERAGLTFVTFGETVYGSVFPDHRRSPVSALGGAVRDRVGDLCRMGAHHALLARQPHLVALSAKDLDELTRTARLVPFVPGDEIVREGAPADAFYVLTSGSAMVTVDGMTRRTIRSGESFGELGILRGGVRSATVTAMQPLEALRVDRAAFLAVFRNDLSNLQPVEAIIHGYEYADAAGRGGPAGDGAGLGAS